MHKLGYYVDLLRGETLAEGVTAQWLHAFPFGVYNHPIYGKLSMTPERARRMAANVNNQVRGIDIAIDYDHNPGPAAGWVKQAEVKDDGLWLYVEWTPDAAERLRKREYRYFSPEFAGSWTDPKTGVKHQDVLLGGGLTNRPFLKDLLPVNLSEILGGDYTLDSEGHVVVDGKVVYTSKEGSMELLKKLAETLGIKLAEDADETAVLEAFKTAFAAKKEQPAPPVGLSEAEIAKLVETHPALATLVEGFRTQQRTIDSLQAANKLSEVRHRMTDWQKGGKWGVPVALTEGLQSLMLSANTQQMELIGKIFDEITKSGLVPLGETKRKITKLTDVDDVFGEVERRLTELRKTDPKLSDHEGLDKIFAEDDALYQRYREASYTTEPAEEEVES